MQEVKLIARTLEYDKDEEFSVMRSSMNQDMTLLAGKAAGVCYMPDDYMENGIQNKDKAFARAEQTSKSGHHSVYDHGHITFLVKTNKIMAMLLNSLGVYATSEKSARYTKMKPETNLELELYEKWRAKIKELILNKYPNIDDDVLNKAWLKQYKDGAGYKVVHGNLTEIKPVLSFAEDKEANVWFREKKENMSGTLPSSKLAQENARYMISVFTPTTMVYTVSYRQLCLIINYLSDLMNRLYAMKRYSEFNKKLLESVSELHARFAAFVEPWALIKDNKNQYIRFLEVQNMCYKKGYNYSRYEDFEERLKAKKEVVGDNYTLVYKGSLAMLAQAQRHRTIRYTMCLNDTSDYGFYTPDIVRDAGLENEWQSDMNKVSYCIPQGTMVRITEQGLFEDFALKCKERMCGRAQLEIMKSTEESVMKFINNRDNLCYSNKKLLETMTLSEDERGIKGLTPCARCKFSDFNCSEGCHWGPGKALNRLI